MNAFQKKKKERKNEQFFLSMYSPEYKASTNATQTSKVMQMHTNIAKKITFHLYLR